MYEPTHLLDGVGVWGLGAAAEHLGNRRELKRAQPVREAGGASQRTQGQGWQGLAGARSRSPLLYIAYEPVGDGSLVAVRAAVEPLLAVTGADLPRIAWHIGNRHTPCQIESDRLLIQNDAVIGHMLEHLGATVTEIDAPFTPEGGAYGHGRTHSHKHGATAHEH